MAKTLTEQIVHIQNDLDVVFAEVVKLEKRLVSNSDESVQKIHILEKKLAIAIKALKEYSDMEKWEYCSPDWRDAEKALKEMESVK